MAMAKFYELVDQFEEELDALVADNEASYEIEEVLRRLPDDDDGNEYFEFWQ